MQIHDKNFELSIPHSTLIEAIEGVAMRLNDDYRDRAPILIGVLNGAFMFMSELARRLDFPCEMSFVKVSSYRGLSSSGAVEQLIGLGCDVRGRDVIIVEDIVETGRSIEHIVGLLHEAASVEVASMFIKPSIYRGVMPIKYPAMSIENDFIVGFGLDYNGLGRNLRDIYRVCG